MYRIIVCLGILVSLSTPGRADVQQGAAAYERGDYSAAFAAFKGSAKQGDAEAQYRLGNMHLKGQGVPQSYPNALNWFQKAAEQGHRDAQYQVAVMHEVGQGVRRKNPLTAYVWYQKAAELGHRDAQFRMGTMYADGQQVPQNHEKAFAWYTKAATQGHVLAQFELGRYYDVGLESSLCTRAASTAKCRKRARAIGGSALDWYMKAASQGYAGAQYKVGEFYEQGRGVKKDPEAAAHWFERAAAQGMVEARYKADLFKKTSELESQDALDRRARAADLRDAEKGMREAQLRVAQMYDRGLGVAKDYVRAYMWYNLAAAQGDVTAREGRDDLEQKMTHQQIGDAQRLSQEMMDKIAMGSAN